VSGVRVFAAKCGTCVFHPGNRMALAPGRLADLIESNRATGTALICHKTTHGTHPEIGETVCRGWFDAYGDVTDSLVIVQRLAELRGAEPFEFVDPPP
jgi:hypothetical protein